MSDAPDWRDPLGGDDEAARERARRRAEREARRRERQDSLGERVRDQLAGSPDAGPAPQAPARPKAAPGAPGKQDHPVSPVTPTEVEPAPPPRAAPTPAPPPPPPPPRRGVVHRRRLAALMGLAALAFFVFVVVIAANRLGGDEPAAEAPAGAAKTTSIVVPEGLSREQMAEEVEQAGVRGDYMEATESFDGYKGFKAARYEAEGAESLEGFLFPATYELPKRPTVEELVSRQLDAFGQNFETVDLSAARAKNLTPHDVLIIASMVEEEVQVSDERPLVASVIYNRLEAGMPLGIDATIRYATGNYDEPLTESELAIDSPYNSRVNAGLPPGPIANPGLASIEAAAKPAKTDYLFFVVKPGTCPSEHAFAATEAEFADLEAEYNAARDAAGGQSPTC